jgi:uncharacterized membrane protein
MAATRERQRLRRASRGRGEAEESARPEEDAGPEGPSPEEAVGQDSGGGVLSQLKDTAADAALAVLKPVAKRAATRAAKFAVQKGPELIEDKVMPRVAEAGGPMALVGQLASGDGNPASALISKVTGMGDDEDGGRGTADGTGKGRRMPIQQAVDVAAPIDVVYDQFTQFEDFPKFMHRVESVEQKDEVTVVFHEKVWGFRRQWEAEIVEQRPDERIVWESVSGLQHVGVVTFHELAERLTRIELNVDIDPSGPVEKIARGARFAKRAARADLKRFKAYVEMEEEETGAWRGEIEDGEVVAGPDEAEDERYEDEPEAYEDEQEPEAEAEDEVDEEPEEDEEEDRKPQPRTRSRSRSSGSRGSSNGSSKSESAAPKRSRGGGSSGRSKAGSKSGSSRSRSSSSKSGSSSGRGRSSSSKSRSSGGGSSRKKASSSKS